MKKKIFLFGNEDCPDCCAMKEALDAEGIRYSYIDIMDSLGKLKLFLKYRDTLAEFLEVRLNHGVGIPFILVDDGAFVSLDPPSPALLAKLKD